MRFRYENKYPYFVRIFAMSNSLTPPPPFRLRDQSEEQSKSFSRIRCLCVCVCFFIVLACCIFNLQQSKICCNVCVRVCMCMRLQILHWLNSMARAKKNSSSSSNNIVNYVLHGIANVWIYKIERFEFELALSLARSLTPHLNCDWIMAMERMQQAIMHIYW